MAISTLSEFLQAFPIPPLHYSNPDYDFRPWVFWSESQDTSSSGVHGKIMSSFFCNVTRRSGYIFQFWAPVTLNGRRLLSTSGQPFAIGSLSKELAMYRQYSEIHKYNIKTDVDNEPDHLIMDGGPATAFLNRFPCVNQLQWIPSEVVHRRLNISIMLPLCLTTTSTCIGVLELTGDFILGYYALYVIDNLKKAGLYVFSIQDHIPYKTINSLKHAKDQISEALEVVCRSHNIALAQVWIAYEDKNHVSFSSPMEETQKKQLLALKLTGCVVVAPSSGYVIFHALCDLIPLARGEELALKTLQDYKSRYIPKLHSDMLLDWDGKFFRESRGLIICLRNNETGDFDYAFEFIWTEDVTISLEAILLTLKKCLPSFKFASGAELGDELDVKTTTCDEAGETQNFTIFQGKRSMKEAAVNLHGSESMLTLGALYGDDIKIIFHIPISQATFATLEKEIGMRLKLSVGTYRLEYLDEEGDWILLSCEEDMDCCIRFQTATILLLRVTATNVKP